jgi:hypothetical protein
MPKIASKRQRKNFPARFPIRFRISRVKTKDMASLLDDQIEKTQHEALNHFKRFNELTASLEELKEIQQECSNGNWEGLSESPIDPQTVNKARNLLFKSAGLPYNIPLPSLSPTSSGLIEMEWYKEKNQRFAIRLNREGFFIYSGLFETVKDSIGNERSDYTHGSSSFTDEKFPEMIKSNLSRLFEIQIK